MRAAALSTRPARTCGSLRDIPTPLCTAAMPGTVLGRGSGPLSQRFRGAAGRPGTHAPRVSFPIDPLLPIDPAGSAGLRMAVGKVVLGRFAAMVTVMVAV